MEPLVTSADTLASLEAHRGASEAGESPSSNPCIPQGQAVSMDNTDGSVATKSPTPRSTLFPDQPQPQAVARAVSDSQQGLWRTQSQPAGDAVQLQVAATVAATAAPQRLPAAPLDLQRCDSLEEKLALLALQRQVVQETSLRFLQDMDAAMAAIHAAPQPKSPPTAPSPRTAPLRPLGRSSSGRVSLPAPPHPHAHHHHHLHAHHTPHRDLPHGVKARRHRQHRERRQSLPQSVGDWYASNLGQCGAGQDAGAGQAPMRSRSLGRAHLSSSHVGTGGSSRREQGGAYREGRLAHMPRVASSTNLVSAATNAGASDDVTLSRAVTEPSPGAASAAAAAQWAADLSYYESPRGSPRLPHAPLCARSHHSSPMHSAAGASASPALEGGAAYQSSPSGAVTTGWASRSSSSSSLPLQPLPPHHAQHGPPALHRMRASHSSRLGSRRALHEALHAGLPRSASGSQQCAASGAEGFGAHGECEGHKCASPDPQCVTAT